MELRSRQITEEEVEMLNVIKEAHAALTEHKNKIRAAQKVLEKTHPELAEKLRDTREAHYFAAERIRGFSRDFGATRGLY